MLRISTFFDYFIIIIFSKKSAVETSSQAFNFVFQNSYNINYLTSKSSLN